MGRVFHDRSSSAVGPCATPDRSVSLGLGSATKACGVDEGIRKLERLAAAGDPEAEAALRRARRRVRSRRSDPRFLRDRRLVEAFRELPGLDTE